MIERQAGTDGQADRQRAVVRPPRETTGPTAVSNHPLVPSSSQYRELYGAIQCTSIQWLFFHFHDYRHCRLSLKALKLFKGHI